MHDEVGTVVVWGVSRNVVNAIITYATNSNILSAHANSCLNLQR